MGAAVGCLGAIFILLVIDPVSATLWIGALAAAAGWMVVHDSGDKKILRLSRSVALIMAAAVLGPDVTFDNVTSTIPSGKADSAFFDSLPENVAPSTDDNPFFF